MLRDKKVPKEALPVIPALRAALATEHQPGRTRKLACGSNSESGLLRSDVPPLGGTKGKEGHNQAVEGPMTQTDPKLPVGLTLIYRPVLQLRTHALPEIGIPMHRCDPTSPPRGASAKTSTLGGGHGGQSSKDLLTQPEPAYEFDQRIVL